MNDIYKLILRVTVDVLKEQLEDLEDSFEARTNPWQALNTIKTQAEVWDVPLSEIGLEGYDIEAILKKRKS